MSYLTTRFQDIAKRLLTSSLILLCVNSYATDPEQREALNHIKKALARIQAVKTRTKKATKYVKNLLDMPPWAYTTVAVLITVGTEKKITTSKISSIKYKGDGWYIKPDLEYSFDGESAGSLNFILDF